MDRDVGLSRSELLLAAVRAAKSGSLPERPRRTHDVCTHSWHWDYDGIGIKSIGTVFFLPKP